MLPEEEASKYRPIKSTDWKWSFKDYPKEKNGLKVFSCFACGGGSTMGYKLAGCEVLGCCEIDPKMNEVYIKNHHPKYNYLMDIREFNKIPDEEIPEELKNLDILDGSPPCTTFSMAGLREESWGKEKKFREGQAEQTLDDLAFIFIETVAKLRPKCVIMENVEGLIKGEAWSYVQKIYKQLNDIGYQVQHWICKGEQMGVPQTRHRVFFIALREDVDFNLSDLDMSFNYEPILFGQVRSEKGEKKVQGTTLNELISLFEYGDHDMSDACMRLRGKGSFFNNKYIYDEKINLTITAKNTNIRVCDKMYQSCEDLIHCSTFPEDYDFINFTQTNVHYICGMSVPPIMIKRIVTRLIESGVFDK
jgi:DNA (cytosine-5)-methyltransferase 1